MTNSELMNPLKGPLLVSTPGQAPAPKNLGLPRRRASGYSILINEIVNWIKDRVKNAGAKGIVMGLSGGIDSAVVSVLAQKAVGENILCLLMPCRSIEKDISDAYLHAKKFNLKTHFVELTKVYDTLLEILPAGNQLAQANLKPRLRMMTLYYFANNLNYLVAGTGNKSEITMGYFTKYGDGGVDILPIGDLVKTKVREIAKELKILDEIITKPPSAGLWEGQTDENEMGITYKELDEIIMAIENENDVNCDKEKIKLVKDKLQICEHKRCGPKMFSRNVR